MESLLRIPPARLLLLLLLCLAVLGTLASSAADDVPAARWPDCVTRCGDIDVPYPFGLDQRCAIHGLFVLNCTTDDEGRTTKLLHENLEVIKISVPERKIWVKNWISRQCYNETTNALQETKAWMNVTDSPYVLSAKDNKMIAVGCPSFAYVLSDSHITGCLSTCVVDTPKNGSCSGVGCCQADLPHGIKVYQGFLDSNYNTSQNWNKTPCNYAAVMEAKSFHFSTTYLTTSASFDLSKPRSRVVMDWAITRKNTCQEARTDKVVPYACESNHSDCVINEAGYGCRCKDGYKGNPYIKDGCTDINECLDNVTYPCAGICKNKLGSFDCSCPRGKRMINGFCEYDSKTIWVTPVIGASVGFVVLVIAITIAYIIQQKRKLYRIKKKHFQQHGGLLLFEEIKSRQGVAFKILSEEELQHATNRFEEQQVIGHGGHGKVYKGVLKGNVEVAVKRCMTISEQQKKEFGKEMLILSQINHKNIVKLLGCCLEVEVPMLVYEFVPNGTLFSLIHGNNGRYISLSTRLRIAYESAEALAYLHSSASPPIIHGDVKSTNILLDIDYTAKVSDFGASILAPNDESQFVTLVQGTCGYLDPEYMQSCQLTDKSDVYSFGVVLLELLTRKKAFHLDGFEDQKSLSMEFLFALRNKKLLDILDDQIKSNENMDLLEDIALLARQCLEMSGVNRPSMKEVAEKLGSLRKVLHHPWAQENSEEINFLGEPSTVNTRAFSTRNFSIENEAAMVLESGR